MKATELRIGNWYNSVKFGHSVQCELVDLYDLCANSEGAFSNPPIDKMFKPIPLTEQWLKDFGFTKHEIKTLFFIDDRIRYDLKHKKVRIIKGCMRAGEAQKQECGTPIDIEINYVHQLQNLYFALTAEELTKSK